MSLLAFTAYVHKSPYAGKKRRLIANQWYGVNLPNQVGTHFAPLYHNWFYGWKDMDWMENYKTPEKIRADIAFYGSEETKAAYNSDVLDVSNNQAVPLLVRDMDKLFKEKNFRMQAEFIAQTLALGYFLGFKLPFLKYVLGSIAFTEVFSYVKFKKNSLCGNSIFGFGNFAVMLWVLYKVRLKAWYFIPFTAYKTYNLYQTWGITPYYTNLVHGVGFIVGALLYWFLY